MPKRPKLSHNQRRQVQKNRDKRLQADQEVSLEDLGPQQRGRVISRYGKHAVVEDCEDLSQHKCFMRRTIESLVCGDYVLYRQNTSANQQQRAIIEAVEDRNSVLTRPDFYDGVKPIAANVEQIVVVSSILPDFSRHIIDRYLVACEDAAIQAIIVLNKVELLEPEAQTDILQQLKIYEDLGYKVLLLSCKTTQGIAALAEHLKDKVSVFVGQSGVGKSSIINALMPEANEAVGDVSENSGLGQHTTTTAKLMHFPSGGELIDSPGVREFSLWHLNADKIALGFVEFRHYLGGCKFKDCTHRDDPGCLISQAVEAGNIDADRYHSFLKIIDTLDKQRPSYAKN